MIQSGALGLSDLLMHPGGRQLRGTAMPQIIKTQAREFIKQKINYEYRLSVGQIKHQFY
jgi:hypothetical protein